MSSENICKPVKMSNPKVIIIVIRLHVFSVKNYCKIQQLNIPFPFIIAQKLPTSGNHVVK